ncbi:lactonase family protein [Cellulomonas shaoxiangyii]|uniref:Lactonase family protein n=1 Tax=Cellulomonas shaoxiangyii TaxID=2566013 RepID=A0A4P7SM66_9CELL|nr:lactonase family protein [Cellulomonas shaoxiangyii]TGY84160.1 lactonase family protein [Cellulomonas shaoxiangyii]
MWVGTYPRAGIGTEPGRGEGVWVVDLDPATGTLNRPRPAVETPAPSFVVAHPSGRVVYAVAEDDPGTVTAFAVDDEGALSAVATVPVGGAHPCHLLLVEDALYVACYSDGVLAVLPLTPDGAFAPEVLAAPGPARTFTRAGSGPVTDRQEGSHAHFVALTPDARHVLVSDLGTDELRRYARAADGTLTDDGVAATLPPGTGPRHVAFAPDARHLYVVGELDAAVHVLAWDAASATGHPVAAAPAVDAAHAGGAAPSPSHVLLEGDRLLLGVRGADVVTTYPVAADGSLGAGTSSPLGGRTPRHLDVVADWTVVALQDSHAVVVLDHDGTEVGRAPIPSPACITRVR